jgi:hypothetical protein
VSENDQSILDDHEVANRKTLLAELQATLADLGIQCRLAGRRRLVLRYAGQSPHAPSGLTDPSLFVLGRDQNVVTTDGDCYRLRDGREFPVNNLAVAAAAICGALEPATST